MSVLGTVFALSAVSCVDYRDKAREKALPYLTGTELLQADSCCEKQGSQSGGSRNREIMYWDSINAEGRAKEAYLKGFLMVKDSAAGKEYSRPDYKMPIMQKVDIDADEITAKQIFEAASRMDAKTLDKCNKNKPCKSTDDALASPNDVHYYGLLMIAGKEREAFEKGAADARADLQ